MSSAADSASWSKPLDPGPTLYLVATPIGNLDDITLRALRVLHGVDLIACEDTRQTQKLLNHYGITTRTVSYHEHNEMTKAAELVVDLEGGAKIALVTHMLGKQKPLSETHVSKLREIRLKYQGQNHVGVGESKD